MTAQLTPTPVQKFWDNNGAPASGAKVFFYVAGTTTKQAAYTDSTQATPLTNPAIANARGEIAIWLDPTKTYKIVAAPSTDTDPPTNAFWTVDNIGSLLSPTGSIIPTVDNLYTLGSSSFSWANVYIGANHAPALDTVSGNIGYYARTAGELSAGITPTNYGYPLGDVRRYGVTCDGSTDDTAAWNAIGTATWAINITLTVAAGLTSKITNTVTLPGPYIALMMDPSARISYAGTYDRAALILGSDTQVLRYRAFNVSVITTGNTWASESSIGVQCRGGWESCSVRINYIDGFTGGFQLWGSKTSGIAYNNFDLGTILNALCHVDLHSAVASGFINENNFYGGDLRITSGGGITTGLVINAIQFRAEPGAYTGQNKNVFYKPSIQITQTAVTGARVPILFNNAGSNNEFISVRCEGLNGECVKVQADTAIIASNTIDIGYVATSAGTVTAYMTETDGGFSYGNRISYLGVSLSQIYHSGDLVSRCFSPSVGNVAVLGMFAHVSGSATEQTSMAARIGKDFLILTSPSAFGVYIDTTYYKNFEVRSDSIAGFCGRLRVSAWDVNDTQIASTRAVQFNAMSQSAIFGTQSYGEASDKRGFLNFRVDSTVKKIKFLFTSGTNQGYLRGFSVVGFASQLQDSNVINGINTALNVWGGPFAPIQLMSTTIPSTAGQNNGFIQRGTQVMNTAAAGGGATSQGWQCTLGGWGARAWVLTTAYLVNDIVTNGGNTYVCTVSGTSAGAGGPAGTGTAIADNTVTWNYIGNYVGIPVVTASTWTAMPNNP